MPLSSNTHHNIRIALLEDDLACASATIEWLSNAGYQVRHFSTGQACIEAFAHENFDLCLLDWQLPDMDGPQVMSTLQSKQQLPPVIFLTGLDSPEHITQVLQAGADDYVVKPPVFSVLHARIHALLRRSPHHAITVEQETLGELEVNYKTRVVHRNKAAVALTSKQTALAFHLFSRRGQLVSRKQLYHVLGVNDMLIDTRRLDVHISNLRRHLGLTAELGWKLASIHQQGYRLDFLL